MNRKVSLIVLVMGLLMLFAVVAPARAPPQRSMPAPVGIADYGLGPTGAYEYTTKSFLGFITIRSLSTVNGTTVTIQLNVCFCFSANGNDYTFWIQNLGGLWPPMRSINFGSFIFNVTALPCIIDPEGVWGNGQVLEGGYYWCYNAALPGQNVRLEYPATVLLNLTSGIDSANRPFVDFAYEDGFGLITYDHVTFNVTGVTSCGFKVSGLETPDRLPYYDSELVLCGPGSVVPTVTFVESDLQLQLEYWNGHNYQSVSDAYNFGSVTAESSDNVISQVGFHPDNGTLFANISAGTGTLGLLYSQNTIGTVHMEAPSSGILYIVNAYDGVFERQVEFSQGEATINVYPGYYKLVLFQDGLFYEQGNFTVNAGQVVDFQAQTDTPIIPEFSNLLVALVLVPAIFLAAFISKKTRRSRRVCQ